MKLHVEMKMYEKARLWSFCAHTYPRFQSSIVVGSRGYISGRCCRTNQLTPIHEQNENLYYSRTSVIQTPLGPRQGICLISLGQIIFIHLSCNTYVRGTCHHLERSFLLLIGISCYKEVHWLNMGVASGLAGLAQDDISEKPHQPVNCKFPKRTFVQKKVFHALQSAWISQWQCNKAKTWVILLIRAMATSMARLLPYTPA